MPARSALLLFPILPLLLQAPLRGQDDDYRLQLEDAVRLLDKGSLTSAEAGFQELLDAFAEEKPADRPALAVVEAAQAGIFEIDLRRGRYQDVIDGVGKLGATAQRREFALLGARAERAVGDYDSAIASLQRLVQQDADDLEARYQLGETLAEDGQRQAARAAWQAAVQRPRPTDGRALAFLGSCHWRLGGREHFETGSQCLTEALQQHPDDAVARTTFGIMKFEAYGEGSNFPSGEKDLNRVLEAHGDVEAALLALYRLRSSNFQLDPGKTERLLERLLETNPRCTAALVLRGASVLDDRRYRDAGGILDAALQINPRHRLALAHRAAVAWLQHDEAAYQRYREQALRGDKGCGDVDRILGDHLVALYRFADALPFYQAALAADAASVPALHGMAKALVYCGEGERAKEQLLKAKDLQPGFNSPWRNNALAVQDLLDSEYTVAENEHFKVQMHRDDIEVLREYLMPLYLQSLDVLGKKYAYRPHKPVKVEVFHTWDDFSVRTIGFRGFTALGACFGTFITLVSPVDSDLRKQDFMWEATVWHEYTHVLTLGLSKHRVPRWLTEGFSVYEEKQRDPSWERGMDRELFDAFANRDIPPVHLLNGLFRGPRILFGYYLGGLIVELIARDFGFQKATELLMAYGEDLDQEAAFQRALGISSKAFDQRFADFVEKERLRSMRLVPHYDDAGLDRLRVRANAEPDNVAAHVQLAWAYTQRNDPVDAGAALAAALRRDPDNASALLVRAELLRRRQAFDEAIKFYERGFAGGADDFDSRIAYGRVLQQQGDIDGAEQQYQRAKALWPNCTEQDNAPELLLAALYRDQERKEQALMEMKAYCKRSARAFQPRWTLSEYERDGGDRQAELQFLSQCNRIDPFYRDLHERMADACVALGRQQEAALEYEVAAAVPVGLDRKYIRRGATPPEADGSEDRADRARLWLAAARLRHGLGEADRALQLLDRVVQTVPGTDAEATARELRQEWHGR